MSGFIAYAECTYKRKNNQDIVVWQSARLNKRSNQSDRGFVRSVDKLMNAHKGKGLLGKDLLKDKTELKFYDKAECDVTTKVRLLYP
jgi:hypothetical protein